MSFALNSNNNNNNNSPLHPDLQIIIEVEKYCEQLYNGSSPQKIHEANKYLESFSSSQECFNKCQLLLDRATVI
jgi:hypothetical protein